MKSPAQSTSRPASPVGAMQLRDMALIKAKRHRGAAHNSLGTRAHMQGLTVTSVSGTLTPGQAPYSLTQAYCNSSVTWGWAGQREERCTGQKGPELQVLGNPARPRQPGPSGGADAWWERRLPSGQTTECTAVAAVWLGRKVSGTEVYFQELTVGPHPPLPTLCPPRPHSQGLTTGGKEVGTSLSCSPFM